MKDISAFNLFINSCVSVGKYSSINRGFKAITTPNTRITIGKYCSIGPGCTCITGNHPMNTPSSSVVLWFWLFENYDESIINSIIHKEADVVIGNDVWVGAGAILLPGVRLGNGSVIGAGSIVTTDVPDYAIFLGNPAKNSGFRFEEPIRDHLLNMRWWDWGDDKVKRNKQFFMTDISALSPAEIDNIVR